MRRFSLKEETSFGNNLRDFYVNVVTVIRWNWSIKEFCGNMRCFRQNYLRKTNNCFIDCYFLFKFHESVVWDNFREEVTHMSAYLFYIEMFQATVAWIMKQYHDYHNFCLWHGWPAVILPFLICFQCIFFHHGIKKLAKIICNTK